MTIDAKPIGFIERSSGDCPHAGPHLGRVRDGGAAFRAETHFQPAAAFVGPMFAFDQISLGNFYEFFVKRREHGERARESALAKFAVANRDEIGLAANAVAHRAAGAAAAMSFFHVFLQGSDQ